MTKQEAIQKAKKLLALAESSNEHEAALAAARAQSVMDTYKLETAMIEDAPDEPEETSDDWQLWDDPIETGRVIPSWKRRLVLTLCKANGAYSYTKRGSGIVLVGSPEACSTTRYIYSFCVRAIDRLAAKQKGNGRTWINNYRIGCCDAIAKALISERSKVADNLRREAKSSQALVRLDKALTRTAEQAVNVTVWAKREFNLVSRSGSSSMLNRNARDAGRADGASIYKGKRRGAIGA